MKAIGIFLNALEAYNQFAGNRHLSKFHLFGVSLKYALILLRMLLKIIEKLILHFYRYFLENICELRYLCIHCGLYLNVSLAGAKVFIPIIRILFVSLENTILKCLFTNFQKKATGLN